MLISRRAFGTLAGGAVLGALTGCNKTSESDRLRSLGGVETVEVVDGRIVLTVVKGLPDKDIRALVEKIEHDSKAFDSSIELVVDGHHGRFYPSPSTDAEVDLERALWLRKDGRATASTYSASGMIVTAPAPVVAAVALGFDQVVPSPEGRRTHRVESADRPGRDNFALFTTQTPETLNTLPLGQVTNGTYTAPDPLPPKLDPSLITRVTTTWKNRTAG